MNINIHAWWPAIQTVWKKIKSSWGLYWYILTWNSLSQEEIAEWQLRSEVDVSRIILEGSKQDVLLTLEELNEQIEFLSVKFQKRVRKNHELTADDLGISFLMRMSEKLQFRADQMDFYAR